jgi:hypothetical protein
MGTSFLPPVLSAVHDADDSAPQSDAVYMVPPFLAYYGVIFQNTSVLVEAYNQVKLYRSYLLDTSKNNLWRHRLLGSGVNDEGHWSTGEHPFLFVLCFFGDLFIFILDRECVGSGGDVEGIGHHPEFAVQ